MKPLPCWCKTKALWRLVALSSLAALTYFVGTEIRSLASSRNFHPHLLVKWAQRQGQNKEGDVLALEVQKPEDVRSEDPEDMQRKEQAEESRRKLYVKYITSYTRLETTKKEKRLPDVIGLGVEKCGSGPLQWMLTHHPMIIGSNPIELHFFGTKKEKKGKEHYRSLMPEVAKYELASEKTPAYFNFGYKNLPMGMKKIVPNAKLVLILCDPINRTYSDFVQEKLMGALRTNVTFETIIQGLLKDYSKMPKNNDSATIDYIYSFKLSGKQHIISTGLYYYHLLRWFKAYNRSQIHIVDGEELLTDPGSVMEKIQDFLKIPKLIIKEDFVRDPSGFYCINAPEPTFTGTEIKIKRPKEAECIPLISKGRTRMGRWQYKPSEAIMESLRKFFEPHNKKLFDLLGRKFDWQQPTS